MKSAEKEFIRFVRGMADLLEAGLSVRNALECMKFSLKRTRCGKLAGCILQYVLEGYAFSTAVQLNTVISVNSRTVSLLAAAEKTGNIAQSLRFIISGAEQREETSSHLVEVSLYPAFVLLVAAVGTVFLLQQYRLFSFDVIPEGAIKSCIEAALFLILFLGIFCITYYRLFCQDAIQLFFYETGFLLSSGLGMTDVLHIISRFSDRKVASLAECMLPDVRSGISFAEVFRKNNPRWNGSEMQMLLDLSSADGNLAGACNSIWEQMKKKSEQKRQVALRMAEPVLLTGTGICLLIMLEGAVLPFLTQFGGVL